MVDVCFFSEYICIKMNVVALIGLGYKYTCMQEHTLPLQRKKRKEKKNR